MERGKTFAHVDRACGDRGGPIVRDAGGHRDHSASPRLLQRAMARTDHRTTGSVGSGSSRSADGGSRTHRASLRSGSARHAYSVTSSMSSSKPEEAVSLEAERAALARAHAAAAATLERLGRIEAHGSSSDAITDEYV